MEAELHSETVIAKEKEETTVSPNHEYALRQEAQNEEAAQSDQADPALCQEEAEPDEALESVSEAALSIEDSRETASAVYMENDNADLHFHFNQKQARRRHLKKNCLNRHTVPSCLNKKRRILFIQRLSCWRRKNKRKRASKLK